jgi:hypothetical protein
VVLLGFNCRFLVQHEYRVHARVSRWFRDLLGHDAGEWTLAEVQLAGNSGDARTRADDNRISTVHARFALVEPNRNVFFTPTPIDSREHGSKTRQITRRLPGKTPDSRHIPIRCTLDWSLGTTKC